MACLERWEARNSSAHDWTQQAVTEQLESIGHVEAVDRMGSNPCKSENCSQTTTNRSEGRSWDAVFSSLDWRTKQMQPSVGFKGERSIWIYSQSHNRLLNGAQGTTGSFVQLLAGDQQMHPAEAANMGILQINAVRHAPSPISSVAITCFEASTNFMLAHLAVAKYAAPSRISSSCRGEQPSEVKIWHLHSLFIMCKGVHILGYRSTRTCMMC